MARRDWTYVHIPVVLSERLEKFLKTPHGKRLGLANKSELLRYVIDRFLEKYNNHT